MVNRDSSLQRRTILVLTLLPEAVWNSVGSVATEDCTLLSRSVSLFGLPLCSWAVVAPIGFHFTITALTVDQGRNLTNWFVGKVASYDGATLKVTEVFSKAILLPMEIAWLCARFYTPVSNGCGWKSRIHSFVYIVCLYNSVLLPYYVVWMSWKVDILFGKIRNRKSCCLHNQHIYIKNINIYI